MKEPKQKPFPKQVDTTVQCFEDVHHEDYGHLCIEDYTLTDLPSSSSVLCFANWDDQRCTSCTHVENLCPRGKGGGYQITCTNIFPKIRSMTVCGDEISYNGAGSGDNTAAPHIVVTVILVLVAFRALSAWYCRDPWPTHHHGHGADVEGGAYQSVPGSEAVAVAHAKTTTELTRVVKPSRSMETNDVVLV